MDRRNRVIVILIGFIAFAGGLLALLLGAGVFGTHRSHLTIFDGAVLRRWDSYGAPAYAVVGAVGLIALVVGLILARREWRRNDGMKRAATIVFPIRAGDRGQTTLDTPALSHALERDLQLLPDVKGARVGLFGIPPEVEMRTVLDLDDDVNLEGLPGQFKRSMDRFERTVGFRPHPIQVTLRFKEGQRQRQLD